MQTTNPTVLVIAIIAIAMSGGTMLLSNYQNRQLEMRLTASLAQFAQQPSPTPTNVDKKQVVVETPDLQNLFEMSKKAKGTSLFYSDELGVGFTYLSTNAVEPVRHGNTIDFNGQIVEVYTKDENATLEQAITETLLQGYNPSDCFVRINPKSILPGYVSASIMFQAPQEYNSPDEYYKNADACPEKYGPTNGGRTFLMNTRVPGKFLFVDVGQDAGASDGTGNNSHNWSESLRIIK